MWNSPEYLIPGVYLGIHFLMWLWYAALVDKHGSHLDTGLIILAMIPLIGDWLILHDGIPRRRHVKEWRASYTPPRRLTREEQEARAIEGRIRAEEYRQRQIDFDAEVVEALREQDERRLR